MPSFAQKLVLWQRRHGRHGLPWQGTRDPYRVWLSEIMLQQTQVAAVSPYYERFLARFPDVEALARATEDEVLRHWAGLGYYARGRNLHAAAKQVVQQGGFPQTPEGLVALPGVGRSTASAIAAFAFGCRAAILDGNVKRVLARQFGVEGEQAQWALAESLLPARGVETYTQAIMDLGATVCVRRNPRCGECPVAGACVARREGRIDALPSPKKRKATPARRAAWAVLVHQGEVLLERRPARGLWGGLWVPPTVESTLSAAECGRLFGCRIRARKPLASFSHGFTHFTLEVQPLRFDVRSRRGDGAAGSESGRAWFPLAEAARAAVPAPVRALLLRLAGEEPVEHLQPALAVVHHEKRLLRRRR